MASRPVFIANLDGKDFVKVLIFEFEWFPGFAKVQKQKSIDSLHKSIKQMHTYEVLEISSKSKNELGINLSAFNLTFTHPKKKINVSVESAFQGSKVFEQGGPFPELYLKSARESKNFFKNKNFGKLIQFNFFGQIWPIKPMSMFYTWIYLKSLEQKKELLINLKLYDIFTDIEFNPKKSINCQAYSAALFISLMKRGLLWNSLNHHNTFKEIMTGQPDWLNNTSYLKHHLI